MTNEELIRQAGQFVQDSPFNYVSAEEALSPEMVGLRIYDEPVWGFGDADDPMFRDMQKREAVGPQFMLPGQWLEGAKSVISFFLPSTDAVKRSNIGGELPSKQWLHARIQGQRMVIKLCEFVRDLLQEQGARCVFLATDKRFQSVALPGQNPNLGKEWEGASFTSNWSERHVAYVCGLGTFSLSKGLITERGMAGRIGSIVVDQHFEPRKRAYTGVYDYCTRCGACVKMCPAGAITLEEGKDHVKCSAYLGKTSLQGTPYYGCGKCQVGVPCSSRIPQKR